VLEYAAGDRRTRAADVLGAGPGSLLVAQVEQAGVSAEVFLCPPSECRGSRGRQYLIVRSRPIVSRVLSQGVYRGYGGALPTGAQPAFVVWLEVDPRQVDVNVHPTKREVRFAEENRVCELVESAVRQALNVIPSASFGYSRAKPGARPEQVREYQPVFQAVAPLPSDRSAPAEQPGQQISLSLRSDLASRPATELPGLTGLVDATVVWQLHRKYLVIPTEEGLLVVDQHVAHERVRYEEALDRLQTEATTSQQLLFPLTLTVNAVELEALRPAQSLLERLGFGIREFGASTFVVDSIPADMKGRGEGEVLYRIADDLIEEKRSTESEIREALAASYACHTAIKAGEELAPPERRTLLARLAGTREPYLCPHGRPTILRIPIGELDRMFGRT
jgi:DNA mismatch repair protein MutL